MEELKWLTKREFAEFWKKDGSLIGSAWQRTEEDIALLCDYIKNGKSGRGAKYAIIEIFDVPKERVHGNRGKTPHNKGIISTKSAKYLCAKAIIQLGRANAYESRKFYLSAMGFESKNLKHIEKELGKKTYYELGTIDQFVYTEVQNLQVALNRRWKEAIGLIERGVFENVTIQKKLFVVKTDGKHEEAVKAFKNSDELYELYEKSKRIAEAKVKTKYGEKLFFAIRTYFINKECRNLIENEESFKELHVNKVAYFYEKIAISGGIEEYTTFEQENEVEDFSSNFFCKFVADRKKASHKTIDKLLQKGVMADFLNKEIMVAFAEELFVFMFENNNYGVFQERYEQIVEEAKTLHSTALQRYVNEKMMFLPNKDELEL